MTKSETHAFRALGLTDSIPNDVVFPYYLDDLKRRIAIAGVYQRFYAFDDLCRCGHEACPLSGRTGTTMMCQCHGSRFDITTGGFIHGSATAALNLYAVQEEEGAGRMRLRREAEVVRGAH